MIVQHGIHQTAPSQKFECGHPMQRVATDIVGPFPESEQGNTYVLVVSHYFTQWIDAYAIPNQEATTVANKLVDEMLCRFAIPILPPRVAVQVGVGAGS